MTATPREVIRFQDKASLSRDAAYRFAALAAYRAATRRPFRVALAGGSTPALLYALLAAPPFREAIAWENVELFFGDDRCVPPDHSYSNFRMVNETLIRPLGLAGVRCHRFLGEMPDHAAAAREYEERLRTAFGATGCEAPRFDLILLGMGPDGHTASLFPHSPALNETSQLVTAAAPGLEPFVPRLTLTLPVLNSAENILFLVSGADKAATLARVLDGESDEQALPSQSVRPAAGGPIWLVDREAAAAL